jgi:hypothetical protein
MIPSIKVNITTMSLSVRVKILQSLLLLTPNTYAAERHLLVTGWVRCEFVWVLAILIVDTYQNPHLISMDACADRGVSVWRTEARGKQEHVHSKVS